MAHRWTECDDIVALYLYRFGPDHLDVSVEEAAATLGISPSSMKMRMMNFQNLADNGGLPHVAQLSQRIFEKNASTPEYELRLLAQNCLAAKG